MSSNNRKLSLITASSLVVASMIGTGVFTSLGFQVVSIKTGFSIILLWMTGGLVAFCGAVTYAELGNAFPRSGGEYSLLTKLYHPALGFVAGWVSATVGFAAPAALAAMALASYLKPIFPEIAENHTAAVCILFFSILHGNSIRGGTFTQNIFTFIKILLILLFILIGFGIDYPQEISIIPHRESFGEIINSNFAVALVYVLYAYTGWNSSIYMIGEIDKPSINLPRSLFLGSTIVTVLYIFLNYIFLYSVPIEKLEGRIDIGYLSGNAILGQSGGLYVSIIIAVLLVSTVSAYVFLGPRITQIMGEDIKALNWFSVKNKNGIPQNAFIFSAILSLIFIYTSSFDEVLIYTSFLLILITALTVGGVFILRIRFKYLKTSYKTWGYPFTPAIFLIISIWTLLYLVIDKFYESMIGIAILLIGISIYLVSYKRDS